ncbi:MAG TPA: hypothetical protein VFJ16_26875, partial [Longimicrobium sp.]|nr:hypothetical protein [Longimicrobium sp.]
MIAQAGAGAAREGQSAETVELVRRSVRDLLQRSEAFQALPPEQQRQIAHETVRVASYLAEPEGIRGGGLRGGDPYAVQQAAPGAGPPKFEAQAAQEGARAAGAFLNAVNFPTFVSGLIQGVFHSIVTSSIEQMEAYGKLVADVAKTLDQFRDENVSVNQGRDHLVDSHPDLFELDMDTGDENGGQPRVKLRDGVDEKAALARVNELPIAGGPLTSLDDDAVESKVVPAARTQLATSRQQLLATMVLMGINRIVVTDGRIAAKVMFDFQARDNFKYRESATRFDYDPTLKKISKEKNVEQSDEGWSDSRRYNKDSGGFDRDRSRGASYAKGEYKYDEQPVLTLASASSTSIDASVQTKAQLMGSV